MSLAVGTQLGPYRIEESIGAGGMGEVYRARDTRLDRMVAIKVLPAHLADRPDLRQRLDREAKAISSLQHPNICALFDIGHENGVNYLVMEYLEGRTLAERLHEGPLPPDELIGIAVQITEALDVAHKRGVVHRDLKPGNVMLTRSGVKLLDFGLAKIGDAGLPSQSALTNLVTQTPTEDPLTAEGTVLGTFQYMAPEQLEGQEADTRSDIFSLGALLYEMATGRKAFQGKSQASLIAAIMSKSPEPITSFQPMIPPALDRVVRTCLEKDPEARWQTAHDVALQLKWIDEGGSAAGVPKPVASRRRNRERTAWIAAAVAGAAAIGLGALWMLQPGPPPRESVRFQIQAPPTVVDFGSPRISPDGRFIAFDGTDDLGVTKIWIRPLNSLEAYPLPGTEDTNRPFWSADSRNLGFFVQGKLKRVPVTGGPPLTLCEFGRGADGVWGSAGQILFDGRTGDSIQVVSAGGGLPAPATRIDRSQGETGHGWPFFLPDGKRFVFIAFRTGEPSQIRLGQLGSLESVRLTEGDSRIEYVAPGYLIFERDGTLLAQPFDAGAGKLNGDPFPLAEGIGTGGVGLAHFSGSASGTLIYTAGDDLLRRLAWFDRTGKELGTLLEPGVFFDPAISPDGRRLALEIDDRQSGAEDIWLVDLSREIASRFTFDPTTDWCPVWSPDSRTIVFASARGALNGLPFRKSTDGSSPAEPLGALQYEFTPGQWLPDGRILGSYRSLESSWDIATIATSGPDTLQTVVSTQFPESRGKVSPDGRFLLYDSPESGNWEVYLTTFPEARGKWQVSRSGGWQAIWGTRGDEILFLTNERMLMRASFAADPEVEIGSPTLLFQTEIPRDFNVRNYIALDPTSDRMLIVTMNERVEVPPVTVILNWDAELANR